MSRVVRCGASYCITAHDTTPRCTRRYISPLNVGDKCHHQGMTSECAEQKKQRHVEWRQDTVLAAKAIFRVLSAREAKGASAEVLADSCINALVSEFGGLRFYLPRDLSRLKEIKQHFEKNGSILDWREINEELSDDANSGSLTLSRRSKDRKIRKKIASTVGKGLSKTSAKNIIDVLSDIKEVCKNEV